MNHLEESLHQLSLEKRKTIPKALKEQLWYAQVGKNVGCTLCYVCQKREITSFTFEAGHVLAVSKGGKTTLDNLRCICLPCNRSMGSENLYVYKNRYHPNVYHPCYVCKQEVAREITYTCCQLYIHQDCEKTFYEQAVSKYGRRRVFLRWSNCPSCFEKIDQHT